MSIIIDVNTIPSVFDVNCSDYSEFKYVSEWINNRKNKAQMVFGGTKYNKELFKMKKYLRYINLLKQIGKVAIINLKMVDSYEKKLEKKNCCKAFNDKHIVAIVAVSNCRIVCSKDSSSYRYLRNQEYYPKNIKKPKIYSGSRTIDLLCKDNIINLLNIGA